MTLGLRISFTAYVKSRLRTNQEDQLSIIFDYKISLVMAAQIYGELSKPDQEQII